MDTAVTKDGYKMTTQPNSTDVPGFAFFSDTLRDALKGHVFYTTRKGYVSGAADLADTVKGCFLGQADDWCTTPSQSINFLPRQYDTVRPYHKINARRLKKTIRMNNLSAAIYMTAQGIPFLQAGEEMLRAKIDASGVILWKTATIPGFCQQYQMGYVREDESVSECLSLLQRTNRLPQSPMQHFVLPMQTMSTQTSLPWTVSTTMCLHSGSTAA